MAIHVGMVSLGCPKNQVDAEIMLSGLQNYGYTLTNEIHEADVVVVNTCGFIESAKQESIETILEFCELKEAGQLQLVVITGCLAERYKDEIAEEIPEAGVIVGLGSEDALAKSIAEGLQGKKIVRFDPKERLALNGDRVLTTLPFYAYLKIAEGCNNRCTFCAIPAIRGDYRSRTMEDILEEANMLADKGVTEIILVAQDTSYYGKDIYGEFKLAELLQKLAKIDRLRWIRVLYCYPERITDELLDVMAAEEKVLNYLDIPLQHVNDRVLRTMARGIKKEQIDDLIVKIRKKIPGVIIRTTLIAGFPGETEEEFAELAQFVKDQQFERLGCFAYSIEEGTKAAALPNQLDEEEKIRRADLVMLEQATIMQNYNESLMGKSMEVLVEGFDEETGLFYGRSRGDAPEIDGKVYIQSMDAIPSGTYVDVTIEKIWDYDLIGIVEGESL